MADWKRKEGECFTGETIDITGNTYIGCEFQNCELQYSGESEEVTSLVGSHIEGCRFVFIGAAGRALDFLAALYATGDPDALGIVEKTFAAIRAGRVTDA